MSTTDRHPVMDAQSALGFLAQASGVLAGSLDYERTLAEVAGLAVPDIADWCAVDIVESDGSLRQITSVHPDPDQEALLMELRRRYREEKGATAGATYAILATEPILASDVRAQAEIELREDEREVYDRLGPRSYMIVPLVARGRTIGALTLLSAREGRHYTEVDLDFAQHLGRRFALAIDNSRLYDEAERSRAMLDTLFRAVPVGLGFVDRDLNCVRSNEALASLSGRSDSGCSGRHLAQLVGSGVVPLAEKVLATSEPLLEHEFEAGGRHHLLSLSPVRAGGGEVAGLGVVTVDVTERRRLHERTLFLAEAGAVLDSSLDYGTTLRNVARLVVPRIADWCAIHMLTEGGAIQQVAAAHSEPEKERLAWEIEDRFPLTGAETSGPAAAIATGATEWNEEIPESALARSARGPEHLEIVRSLKPRSSIVVPLRSRGRTLGAITLVLAESERLFGEGDVGFAEDLAQRASLAIENSRLYTERSRIAHTLQAELLPARLPEIPGVTVAVRYRAAGELNEVGGDFYDVFPRGDGDWGLMIGDVSGKGAEAAAVTALARHTVRTASLQSPPPSGLLETLNEALRTQRRGSEFCTVCVGSLSSDRRSLRLALGGHPPALVLRADGSVEAHGEPGTLIGVFPDPSVTDSQLALGAGDTVLLYTDGVTEAGPVGEELGDDGLAAILQGLAGYDPEQIVTAVERAAVEIQDGQPRDDIALVALRIDP